jgi:hypothetical protein
MKRWWMHWSWRKEDIRTVGRRRISRPLMQLLPSVRGDRALWRLRSCRITHSIPFIWQLHRMLWMEKTFIKFHADADNILWCETSRLKWALVRVEMTFSWIDRTKWVHEVACEIIMTWLRSERTPWWVLGRICWYKSTIRVERLHESTCETTTIWIGDRREPSSTLGWKWMMWKHYLRKSSKNFKPIRKIFWSSSLGEVLSIGPGHDLL